MRASPHGASTRPCPARPANSTSQTLGEQLVLDELLARVEQAQLDAARHESGVAAVRAEAGAAKRAVPPILGA